MAFSQAVSGLNAAAGNLDVIGNNIANAATYGFKSSTVAFSDIFAGSQVGLGVKVSGVNQNFKDGTPTTTNRTLDLAITQGGFFRMQGGDGGIYYSRNGQFKMDENRNIINMQGMKLTGYPAASVNGGAPEIQKGANPEPITIPQGILMAKATTKVTMTANLNSMHKKPTEAFSPENNDSYNYPTSVTTFDSLGNPHAIQVFFVKTNDNEWQVHAQDSAVEGAKAASLGTLKFDGNGKLIGDNNQFTFNVPSLNGSNAADITIDFNGSKQQKIDTDSISAPKQDGYAAGEFKGYRIEQDGRVIGTYTNEQSQLLGQIVLTNFANPEGLAAKGDNVWVETSASGNPVVGIADSGGFGKLLSGSLEASNVDMSQELVNMIVAQRNYQSSAQTIKTQDQILQTLVSMR
ncbi:flagellar hook-basal body complex protein [Photorhabdus laumondii subsp. laumondii]|uniref:Flagellar hook protein FlgE n=2 Tax=Photorhabdus laumondii subsp. laumondii TaxID=141679 RepID=Q7N5N0_PHOLL|nr:MULTISPECIES: flagellar hook protein FlgE [Photorhabdus]AWK41721.1 flagellar biosynthesis protein FlgE [Photorhabdus laumondii subsp. laumondii]AXG42541.1 flagellar hook protein FlgE [Photorhabdus laumondii subsp. laumondii]AXG47043.1 flagellar hook protein FlgE [Photorhabdus laumondii subsp. laumondii]MCC8382457.1 flagellar hook protein FlgE [Photorhabdus laumondii]MCC8387331.1 flagellar hook protein FlgE [Photorhabdus laumondii]